MPRPSAIDQFGEKLNLMLEGLTLPRSRLAQAVGVDKSVIARWISGQTRPAEPNMARLTELARREVPDFGRGDWVLSVTEFAARMRVPVRAVANEPDVASVPDLAQGAALYGGLWLLTHSSFTGMRRLFAFLMDLRAESTALRFELSDGFGYRARGTARTGEGKLCLVGDAVQPPNQFWPSYLVFNGVQLYRAMVIDGIMLSWCRDIARTPTALRTIGWRIGATEPDPTKARQRFEAAAAHIVRQNQVGAFGQYVPKWVAAETFNAPRSPAHGSLRVVAEHSLAIDEMALALAEPANGRRKQVLRTLQLLFEPVLQIG